MSRGPVRLVKLIGDAAMFASVRHRRAARLDARARRADGGGGRGRGGCPLIRAGLAYGPVFTRGGDYYGRAVNLASRITETARPGSVLVTPEIRDHADEGKFTFSRARRKHLKGISGSVELFRCRRNGDDGEDEAVLAGRA